jgi:hypothetical protein
MEHHLSRRLSKVPNGPWSIFSRQVKPSYLATATPVTKYPHSNPKSLKGVNVWPFFSLVEVVRESVYHKLLAAEGTPSRYQKLTTCSFRLSTASTLRSIRALNLTSPLCSLWITRRPSLTGMSKCPLLWSALEARWLSLSPLDRLLQTVSALVLALTWSLSKANWVVPRGINSARTWTTQTVVTVKGTVVNGFLVSWSRGLSRHARLVALWEAVLARRRIIFEYINYFIIIFNRYYIVYN